MNKIKFGIIPKPRFFECKKELIKTGKNFKVKNFGFDENKIKEFISVINTRTKLNFLIVESDDYDISLKKEGAIKKKEYSIQSIGSKLILKTSNYEMCVRGFTSILQTILMNDGLIRMQINDGTKYNLLAGHAPMMTSIYDLLDYIFSIYIFKYNAIHIGLSYSKINLLKYPKIMEVEKKWAIEWEKEGNQKRADVSKLFYSDEELKRVVDFCNILGIKLIPQFTTSGHSYSLLAAYPEMACLHRKISGHHPIPRGKLEDGAVCIGNPKYLEFIKYVLNRYIEIFKSNIIHIGGDECPTFHWEKCNRCKDFVKKEKLGGVNELQKYITYAIRDYAKERNIEIAIWDDQQEYSQVSGLLVSFWRAWQTNEFHDKNYLSNIIKNNKTILSPVPVHYFDFPQGLDDYMIGEWEFMQLEDVYNYNFKKLVKDPEDLENIEGYQFNLWAGLDNAKNMQWRIFPRCLAVSERGWGTMDNYESFRERLLENEIVLKKLNINYYKDWLNKDVPPTGVYKTVPFFFANKSTYEKIDKNYKIRNNESMREIKEFFLARKDLNSNLDFVDKNHNIVFKVDPNVSKINFETIDKKLILSIESRKYVYDALQVLSIYIKRFKYAASLKQKVIPFKEKNWLEVDFNNSNDIDLITKFLIHLSTILINGIIAKNINVDLNDYVIDFMQKIGIKNIKKKNYIFTNGMDDNFEKRNLVLSDIDSINFNNDLSLKERYETLFYGIYEHFYEDDKFLGVCGKLDLETFKLRKNIITHIVFQTERARNRHSHYPDVQIALNDKNSIYKDLV